MNEPISDNTLQSPILHGSVTKQLLYLSLPLTVPFLLYLVCNMVSTYFVGQINTDDPSYIGGIGLMTPVMLIVAALSGGIYVGTSSLVARAIGSQSQKILDSVVQTSLLLSLLVGGGTVVVGYLFSSQIVYFLADGNPEFSKQAEVYLIYLLPSFFFYSFQSTFLGIFQGEGKMKYAMVIIVIGAFFNFILDPLLILYFDLKVAGAGLAKSVSSLISLSSACALFMFGKSVLRPRWRGEISDAAEVRPAWREMTRFVQTMLLKNFYRLIVVFALGMVLNFIFEPFLLLYFDAEVVGSGLSKSLSLLISLVCVYLLFRGAKRPWRGKVSAAALKDILAVGSLQALGTTVMSVQMMLFNKFYMATNANFMTATTIFLKFEPLAYLFVYPLATAVLTMVGQNYGNKNYPRLWVINKATYKLGFACVAPIVFLIITVAPLFYHHFSTNAEVLAIATTLTYLITFKAFFVLLELTSRAYFQAIKHPVSAFLITLFRILLVPVPLAYLFYYCLELGPWSVPVAVLFGEIIPAPFCVLAVRYSIRMLASNSPQCEVVVDASTREEQRKSSTEVLGRG